MRRVLVISDIHGELEKFNQLLQEVKYDMQADQLILLGDYVDRGPDSCGVLNKVMELKEQGAIVLRGNHDDMMLAAAEGEPKAWERWMKNGAVETLHSYEPEIDEWRIPETDTFKKHVEFIKGLDYYYELDQYIFVHGGVHPETPLNKTDPYVFVWIRDEFHHGYRGDKTVIFGHTRTARLHSDKENNNVYFGKNNIIGIDGGAVYGGQLNCLDLTNKITYRIC